jgi:hypothetical protein
MLAEPMRPLVEHDKRSRLTDGVVAWWHRWRSSSDLIEPPGAWLRGFAYGALVAVLAYTAATIMRRVTLGVAGVSAAASRDR